MLYLNKSLLLPPSDCPATTTQVFFYHVSFAHSKPSWKWDHISLFVVMCSFFLSKHLRMGLLGHRGRYFSLTQNCQIFFPIWCTILFPTSVYENSNSSTPSPTYFSIFNVNHCKVCVVLYHRGLHHGFNLYLLDD